MLDNYNIKLNKQGQDLELALDGYKFKILLDKANSIKGLLPALPSRLTKKYNIDFKNGKLLVQDKNDKGSLNLIINSSAEIECNNVTANRLTISAKVINFKANVKLNSLILEANKTTIHASSKFNVANISNVKINKLQNYGKLYFAKDSKVDLDIDTFENKGLFSCLSQKQSITVNNIVNSGEMTGFCLSLKGLKNFYNTGLITATDVLSLIIDGDEKSINNGIILSSGLLNLSGSGKLVNNNIVSANKKINCAISNFINNKLLLTKDLLLSLGANLNNKAVSFIKGVAELIDSASFNNGGLAYIDKEIISKTKGKFLNSKYLSAQSVSMLISSFFNNNEIAC